MSNGSIRAADVFSDGEEVVIVLVKIGEQVMTLSFQLDDLEHPSFQIMPEDDVYDMSFKFNLAERVEQ